MLARARRLDTTRALCASSTRNYWAPCISSTSTSTAFSTSSWANAAMETSKNSHSRSWSWSAENTAAIIGLMGASLASVVGTRDGVRSESQGAPQPKLGWTDPNDESCNTPSLVLRDGYCAHMDGSFDESQRWSVTTKTLKGGKQEGVELITLDNGMMQIRVVPCRGCNVLDVVAGDVSLGWSSPVKEVVHPRMINLHDRDGLGWLDGFNELVVRCGLSWCGHPGIDKFVDSAGNEQEMRLTVHGKVGNIPASNVHVTVDQEYPHRIRLKGRVTEAQFYGPNLSIQTEVSTVPGSNEFTICDVVTNHGAFPEEFQLMYHTNFGGGAQEGGESDESAWAGGLLGQGSRMVSATKSITPFTSHAARAVGTADTYAGPVKGFEEEVFKRVPLEDGDGMASATLLNPSSDRGVTMAWPIDQMPCLTQWKNTAATKSGYVTGIEPGTCYPHHRKFEREHGRVAKLAPGESRTFELHFRVLMSEQEVKAACDAAARVQARAAPKVLPLEN